MSKSKQDDDIMKGKQADDIPDLNEVKKELGDLMLTILRIARIKNINLHERLMYSLEKVKKRKEGKPKE